MLGPETADWQCVQCAKVPTCRTYTIPDMRTARVHVTGGYGVYTGGGGYLLQGMGFGLLLVLG